MILKKYKVENVKNNNENSIRIDLKGNITYNIKRREIYYATGSKADKIRN